MTTLTLNRIFMTTLPHNEIYMTTLPLNRIFITSLPLSEYLYAIYNFSRLSIQLNELEANVAPTDSRLRPDQRLMEDTKCINFKMNNYFLFIAYHLCLDNLFFK